MDCECNSQKTLPVTKSNSIGYGNAFKSYYLEAFTASSHRVQVLWRDVVSSYDELTLTYLKDTLPALSGIAKRFMTLRPGDRYLAGLWEQSYAEDLIWRTGSSQGQGDGILPRPQTWRAPTWSWASVDSTTSSRGSSWNRQEYDQPRWLYCIDVLAAQCIPAGDDITGELSDGFAVIRGAMMAGHFMDTPHKWERYHIARDGREATFWPDYVFDVDNETRVNDGSKIFCLRVATNKDLRSDGFDDYFVLRRKRGSNTRFERIGYMMLKVNGEGKEFHLLFQAKQEDSVVHLV
jgi:hypothetical protein